MNRLIYWTASLLFLSACMSSPEDTFRGKGKKVVKELTFTLRNVENHEELQAASPQLRKLFKKLALLLLEVRHNLEKHPEMTFSSEVLEENEELFSHLARLYEIPGCREIMERSQGDAVYLLLQGR